MYCNVGVILWVEKICVYLCEVKGRCCVRGFPPNYGTYIACTAKPAMTTNVSKSVYNWEVHCGLSSYMYYTAKKALYLNSL